MKYDPKIHHRKSIRLKDYDYSGAGAYFITISAFENHLHFGRINNSVVELNSIGSMVRDVWLLMPERFPNMVSDEYIVMPNHFHSVIMLEDIEDEKSDPNRAMTSQNLRGEIASQNLEGAMTSRNLEGAMTSRNLEGAMTSIAVEGAMTSIARTGEPCVRPHGTAQNSIGRIIQAFKSITALKYIKLNRSLGTLQPGMKLWHRNYYEHIIRDEKDYIAIREYIISNPVLWELDRFYRAMEGR